MSLMTRAHLLDKYGMRLTTEQLAEVLGWSVKGLQNAIAAGEFFIPTYREGQRRYASYEDVADYFDRRAEQARAELAKKNPGARPGLEECRSVTS